MSVDLDVIIIGAGLSGVGFAIKLQQQFPHAKFQIFEKEDSVGGAWLVNTYPGCGCDVPSHFYSYSFVLNPNWSQKFALQPEISAYVHDVAEKYGVPEHVSFQASVESATYEEHTGTWRVRILDQRTGETFEKRSRVLISAVGALSVPNGCDIQGHESFRGRIFHSAHWDHSFDWAGKDVVVVGNGCSATQFVPVMNEGQGRAKSIVQFSRQPHWLSERPNPTYSVCFKLMMRCLPLAMRIYRLYIYLSMEKDFLAFKLDGRGSAVRETLRQVQTDYIMRAAPEEYREALIPTTKIGCKRRVMDTGYLQCLHRDNVELVHSDPIEHITESGVTTASGRHVAADAIVLANEFKTQEILFPLKIFGQRGISLNEHWERYSSGAAQAYYGTCISEFPNLFIMMGPNTTTGHLSVIYSTECQMDFTLRILQPILTRSGQAAPGNKSSPDTVMVTLSAEQQDNSWIQSAARKLVWDTGCSSWYLDQHTGRNTMLYPDWQFKFWLRSRFFPISDFIYRVAPVQPRAFRVRTQRKRLILRVLVVVSIMSAAAFFKRSGGGPKSPIAWYRGYVDGILSYVSQLRREVLTSI